MLEAYLIGLSTLKDVTQFLDYTELGFPLLSIFFLKVESNSFYNSGNAILTTDKQPWPWSCNLVKWWHFLLTLKTTKGWNFCCRLHMQCATFLETITSLEPLHCTIGSKIFWALELRFCLENSKMNFWVKKTDLLGDLSMPGQPVISLLTTFTGFYVGRLKFFLLNPL